MLVSNASSAEDHHRFSMLLQKEDYIKANADGSKKQWLNESKVLDSRPFCSAGVLKGINKRKINLDNEKYVEEISSSFDSANAMIAAMCVAETFFFSEEDTASVPTKVRSWIREIKQIEGNTSSGDVFKAKVDGKYPFVIKYPQDQYDTLIHEYFVGVYALNKLRAEIPNFAYMFGIFQCSGPVVIKGKVNSWCADDYDGGAEYIVYENIEPAVTMKEFTKTASPVEWMNAYMQVLYSLHKAHTEFDFTHYDLHATNVMIRSPGRGTFSIKYDTEQGTEYIETDFIATMIDFGLSHIKYKGEHYGSWSLQHYGILPRGSHPLHDAYKLLMFSALQMDKQSALFAIAENIYEFFKSPDTLQQALISQGGKYYYLPLTEESDKLTLLDLTKHIRSRIVTPFISKTKPANIIGCEGRACKSIEGYIDSFFGKATTDAFVFYDVVQDLQESSDFEEMDKVIGDFEYNQALNQVINRFNDLSTEICNTNIVANIMKGQRYRVIVRKTSDYKDYVSKVIDYYDKFAEYEIVYKVAHYIATLYSEMDTAKVMRESYNITMSNSADPREFLKLIRSDYRYVSENKSVMRAIWRKRSQPAYDAAYKWWNDMGHLGKILANLSVI